MLLQKAAKTALSCSSGASGSATQGHLFKTSTQSMEVGRQIDLCITSVLKGVEKAGNGGRWNITLPLLTRKHAHTHRNTQ